MGRQKIEQKGYLNYACDHHLFDDDGPYLWHFHAPIMQISWPLVTAECALAPSQILLHHQQLRLGHPSKQKTHSLNVGDSIFAYYITITTQYAINFN